MGEAAKKETSMEDILASIRKIITSDEANTKNGASTDKPSDNSSSAKDVDASRSGTGASNASVSAQSAQPGSLAALSAQLKAQMPSKPSTPLSNSQATPSPEVKSEAASQANAVGSTVEEKQDTPKEMTPPKSLGELASRVTAQPQARLEPSKPVPNNEPRLKPDAESRFSGESLRELASRVAASKSQKPDAPVQQAATSQPENPPAPKREEPPASMEPTAASQPDAENAAKPVSVASETVEAKDETAFKEALVAPATQKAVTGSMDRLRQAAENVDAAQVEAILRPMLKEWLDANLPSLVEKMVQQEISRISGK